jgi:hypothetical protein
MYCPNCRDEYRPGFTRCATCDVPLVPSLDAGTAAKPAAVLAEIAAEEDTANFCGFLTLEEARQAREQVQAAGMPAEILIKDAPAPTGDKPDHDEYWLRVRPRDFRAVIGVVGFEPPSASDGDGSFGCSACGAMVPADAETCPGCGLRFEE